MALRLLSGPTEEPLTLDEVKAHCRVDAGMGSVDDAWLMAAIVASRQAAEARMQRTVVDSTYVMALDAFSDDILLPMPRAILVTEVRYVDPAGVSQVLASNLYSLDNASDITNWLLPAYGTSWPATRDQANAVQITYRAGWPDAASVPASVKLWMKLAIGAWYDVRAGMDISPLPLQAYELPSQFFGALLDPWTVTLV